MIDEINSYLSCEWNEKKYLLPRGNILDESH